MKPAADEQIVYEGDKRLHAYYYEYGAFLVGYSLKSGCITLLTDMNTGDKTFYVMPNTDPVQKQINEVLVQAELPFSLSFWRNTYSREYVFLNYTGSGEDIYFDNIDVYMTTDGNGLLEFSVYETEGGGDEVRDAMRKLLCAIAYYYDDQYTKEFMDAFFSLENYKDSTVPVYNQYGAYVLNEFGWYGLYQEQGKYEIYWSDSTFRIERNDDYKETHPAVDINTLLAPFVQKHPGYLDTESTLSLEQLRYTVIHPESEDIKFDIYFTFRRPDLAVTQIDITYLTNGDKEKERWFQEVTADLAALCSAGLTSDDVMELYAQAVNIASEGPPLFVNSYSNAGMTLRFQQTNSLTEFSIVFDLEPLRSSENIFLDLNAWGGPSVVDGQFHWMYYYDRQTGWVNYIDSVSLNMWLDLFYHDIDENILFAYYIHESFKGDDGTQYKQLRISLDEARSFWDTEHYMLTMVFDAYPHFELKYNENYSKLMGLEDGYYYEGTSAETIRLLPTGLSLLCDDGMTASEAKELFSHAMEPDEVIDGIEVIIYCPREVAHILAYNPQTGACKYTAMTRDDISHYGGGWEEFIQ